MVVFLIILAFFVALFTIRVKVTLEMKDELYLTVFAFGATLRILPKKPKKYKLRDYTPKKIAKRDAKKAKADAQKAEKKRQRNAKKAAEKQKKKDAQAKLTKEQKKAIREKKRSSRPPIPDILELLFKIIRMFFSGFFAKFHFHVARIRIKIGSSDAATTALLWCTVSTARTKSPVFFSSVTPADISMGSPFFSLPAPSKVAVLPITAQSIEEI